MDSLPSDNESDCVYVSEDKTCSTSNSTPFSKNPKTTLDFLMLESQTYEKYKIAEMIKQQIAEFSFDKKIIDELIATIKTGLKALDKKPTKPKTTKGGGKRCQKK